MFLAALSACIVVPVPTARLVSAVPAPLPSEYGLNEPLLEFLAVIIW